MDSAAAVGLLGHPAPRYLPDYAPTASQAAYTVGTGGAQYPM